MTIAECDTTEERELTAVLRWRFSQLARSGYGLEEAVVLATTPDVDLHSAAELLERGCPPALALRILL